MSYAAEPYAQFVEDLLLSLTGGVSRERFAFLPEDAPFRLAPPGPVVRSTLRVFGQVEGAYHRFVLDTDYALTPDNVVEWKATADGTPAADAVWPDEGTAFYVNYDYQAPPGSVPRLNDRNPGSIVRLFSESFAREYAVLSRQLEAVYRAGFLDTSTGRDLDQLVALVGITRRDRTFAIGTAIFGRTTPSPADIFIPEGTRLSTAEPPLAEFETSEDRTLHRGNLSVEVPIRARTSGTDGVVPAGAVRVMHRPILGVEEVQNPQGTQLSGDVETDEVLRMRARRALESAGQATIGALTGRLASLPGVREKDVLLTEDAIQRPGVVVLTVAAKLDQATGVRAIDIIEETRPAGVRVIHRLDARPGPTTIKPSANLLPENENQPPQDTLEGDGMFAPVIIKAIVVPTSAALTSEERAQLKRESEEAITAAVEASGVGEPVIYNRVVAALMAVSGVQDVALDLYWYGQGAGPRHRNLYPGSTLRPTVDPDHLGQINVLIGGEVVALDVSVIIHLETLPGGDRTADLEAARVEVLAQLRDNVSAVTTLTPANLLAQIHPPTSFSVTELHYTGEYLTAGVQLTTADQTLPLTAQEVPWVRNVAAADSNQDS
ncbi:MAG TPA: baseplate J/gp47 family protein [Myxococcaceae bacterium]|jgi:uncharacterized phage protein gp47/JayE